MQDEHDDEFIPEDEAENSAATIKKLREKLKLCEAEKQEYLTGWQRAKADFINARKTEEAERDRFRKAALEKTLLDFLSVADSFEMAFAHKESWQKVDAGWRVGVESIYSQLLSAFARHGLTTVGAVGEPFDPRMHVSVGVVSVEKKLDDTVQEVTQTGYKLNDTVIRPAKVKVGQYEEANQ